MSNQEIKELMKENSIYMWEVAKQLGVNETSFCKWFREPLTEEKQQRIILAIEEIRLDRLKQQK